MFAELLQVIQIKQLYKYLSGRLHFRSQGIKLVFIGARCIPCFEALQVDKRIVRLHHRQSLDGASGSRVLHLHRHSVWHQLQTLQPGARPFDFRAAWEDLLQDQDDSFSEVLLLSLQETNLLQVALQLLLGSCLDLYAISTHHSGERQNQKIARDSKSTC